MKDLAVILEKHGYKVSIFDNSKDVKEAILNEIKSNDSVGFGGSTTINDLGIYEELEQKGNSVYWHWKAADKREALNKSVNTDVYICSTNALTLDGKLVNRDGNGNRVASMIFGHKRVYIVIGKNKICKDYSEAKERIDTIAAPKNAERLKLNTPCRFTGRCSDCESPDRMCKAETILHRKPDGSNIYLYLVNEELGF